MDQPGKDLRNPLAEDTHLRISYTARWIDEAYLERPRAVLVQDHDQFTAIDRRSHIKIERLDQSDARERACKVRVAVVDRNGMLRLDCKRFIAHEKFDWL